MNTITNSYAKTISNYFRDIINPICFHITSDMNLNGNDHISIWDYEKIKDSINIDTKKIRPWVCISSYNDRQLYDIIYSIESNIRQFYILYNRQSIWSYEFIKIIIIGLVHELRHVYQFQNNLFDPKTQESLMETDAELFAGKYFEYDKEYFNLHIQDVLNKYSKLI